MAHNTRHGRAIDIDDLPIIRYYRKEDHVLGYYGERFLADNKKTMINAIIDMCKYDMFIETENL